MTTVTVTSGQTYNISSGDSDTNDTVDAGGTLNVLSGGSASYTFDYGIVNVDPHGIDIQDTVSGTQYVFGLATSAYVEAGGVEIVEYQPTSGIGLLIHVPTPTALDTTILSGGTQLVSAGIAIGTEVIGGQTVEDFGVADQTLVLGAQDVYSGGIASGTVIADDGLQIVSDSGIANDTMVAARGEQQLLSGGTAIGVTLSSGGDEYTQPGGTAIGVTVENGGQQTLAGGVASGTVVNGGGTQYVNSVVGVPGVAISTVVNGGGIESILDGSTAIGTVLYGDQYVYDSSTATGTIIQAGGEQYLYDNATASNTVLDGKQLVLDSTSALDTTIDSGGQQYVEINANASGTVINSAGAQYVYDYTTVSDTVINNGGDQYLHDCGTAIVTVVNSGGEQYVEDYATASNTTVSKGGLVDVEDYGTAVNPILAGGSILVTGTLAIENQGLLVSGGDVSLSPGAEIVLDNAQLSGTIDIPSGVTVDAIGGTNVLLTTTPNSISNGGVIRVDNGATLTLSGTIPNSGTLLANTGTLVFAGTIKGGTTLINNGVVDIPLANSVNVDFESGGSGGLVLEVASAYSGKISGFGFGSNSSQYLDLADISSAGAILTYTSTSSDSGVLTVSSGGHKLASIDFIGHYVTSNFIASNDGTGHLEITDPPVGTTLASTVNSSSSPSVGADSVPLLGMYMAALFASPEGQVSTEAAAEMAHSVAALAPPHTG